MNMKKGILLIVFSAFLFGMMPIVGNYIYTNGGTPFFLTFYRFFFSIPFLFFISYKKSEQFIIPTKKQLLELLLLCTGFVTTPLLLFSSYKFISPGMATTVHFAYPALVVLASGLIFKEKITVLRIVCCLFCMVGVFCFYSPTGQGSITGILLSFLSSITYAFYILTFLKSTIVKFPPFLLAAYLSLFSSIMILPIVIVNGDMFPQVTITGWCATLAFALAISCVAVVAFQTGSKCCGAQTASFLSTFEPLTSILFGVILGQEVITFRICIGILLILATVMVLSFEKTNKTKIYNND